MADVSANSMACHSRATYHIAGCCHLVKSLSSFQSHIAGCSHLVKSMSWSCHIAGCQNSIHHIENRFRHILFYILFVMHFRLWGAAAFVSSPIHLFVSVSHFSHSHLSFIWANRRRPRPKPIQLYDTIFFSLACYSNSFFYSNVPGGPN